MNEGNRALLAEYGEEYGQDDADNDTRGEGKVKTESFPFNRDVSREAADIGNLVGKHEAEPGDNEQQTKNNEHSA
jgi:hypothetical protein